MIDDITIQFKVKPGKNSMIISQMFSCDDMAVYRNILLGIAVNCIKTLGRIDGVEGTIESVNALIYDSKFRKNNVDEQKS